MKLYQPVLFVGLGGSGCQIGAALERRLREEICGPDGALFQSKREDAQRYQLPACLQFVYADVNQAELDRMPKNVVPGTQHAGVAELNAHYVKNLVPQVDTYPQVAQNLRLAAGDAVRGWLPPAQGEPRVLPLQKGAGQMPTVGRAALFETFREGLAPAVRDLDVAIGNLSGQQAATDLDRLAGAGNKIDTAAVDVFVAFSVAGGTGAGIFYDYLHLIDRQLRKVRLKAKIYPLVLMPSAFKEGAGGGRHAELNAARALLDLFRLVDQQNNADAVRDLPGLTAEVADPEEIAVHYPLEGRVAMRPGVAQTAFLFSRPSSAQPGDLHRSVVSLLMSLVGTELGERRSGDDEQHQSFADSFVNSSGTRQTMAENGIGNRGVSTALVTSLTTPVEELADVVASRLLREGVEELREPVLGIESNKAVIEEFLTLSHVHPVFARRAAEFAEPEPVVGAKEVTAALSDRLSAMRTGLTELRARLDRDVPTMIGKFDPAGAVVELLRRMDPFHVRRVIFGHAVLNEPDRDGAAGLLRRRMEPPRAPAGLSTTPPPLPRLRDRSLGLAKVKWTDDEVVTARHEQDVWYRWRTWDLWTEPWHTLSSRWLRALDLTEDRLRSLAHELDALARRDRDDFRKRSEYLYRRRDGVAFHLPPGNLEQFYQAALSRIRDVLQVENGDSAELLRRLIGEDGWRQIYRLSVDKSAERAVDELRERVKTGVKTCLQKELAGRPTLPPKLRDLLDQAAGVSLEQPRFSDAELDDFVSRLKGLVPVSFTPQGTGPMKILVTYPGSENPAIRDYLEKTLTFPSGRDLTIQYTSSTAETISVVLFRHNMGITQVEEVRHVLRTWADAGGRPLPDDFLAWRQRTGYQYGYLATREEHRVRILHRLLCALWNGDVHVTGDPATPSQAMVRLNEVTMILQLKAMEDASSWASLLQAYELWSLAESSDQEGVFCRQLMQVAPLALEEGGREPSKLFELVMDLAESQKGCIRRMLDQINPAARPRAELLLAFWERTLPAALEQPFELTTATQMNLRDLHLSHRRRKEATL